MICARGAREVHCDDLAVSGIPVLYHGVPHSFPRRIEGSFQIPNRQLKGEFTDGETIHRKRVLISKL
jgi:hypothetical protein